MMFVDESGDPGYPRNGNWESFEGSIRFARVGAILHGRKWRAWNRRLTQFKQNRGLTWDSELKASHIRRGEGAFVGWDRPRRDLFMQDILQLIGGNIDITILGIVIDKTQVDITRGDRLVKPEIRSMELLLERYNLFLRQQRDRNGIVVLDPVHEDSDDNIRHFQSYLQARSVHLQPLHIVESTFFAKSHTSNMIQISDICSNVFYRHENGRAGSENEFTYISNRFWRCNNRIQGYGIKRWP